MRRDCSNQGNERLTPHELKSGQGHSETQLYSIAYVDGIEGLRRPNDTSSCRVLWRGSSAPLPLFPIRQKPLQSQPLPRQTGLITPRPKLALLPSDFLLGAVADHPLERLLDSHCSRRLLLRRSNEDHELLESRPLVLLFSTQVVHVGPSWCVLAGASVAADVSLAFTITVVPGHEWSAVSFHSHERPPRLP